MAESVISVAGLRKSYGELEAVRGIDLEVAAGRGLRLPGAERGGQDHHGGDPGGLPAAERRRGQRARRRSGRVRARVARSGSGSCFRTATCSPSSPCGSRSSSSPATTRRRAPWTRRSSSSAFGPEGRSSGSRRLSGGQQRRLDVGAGAGRESRAAVPRRADDGFDPSARRQAWEVIASLRELGKTVFLTTHYMDEAQALADRVAIIAAGEDRGRGRARRAGRPRRRRPDQLPAPDGRRRRRASPRGGGGAGRRRGAAPERPGAASNRRPGRDPQRSHGLGSGRATSTWRSSRFAGRASRTCTWS